MINQEPEEVRRARETFIRKMHRFGLPKGAADIENRGESSVEAEFREYSSFVDKLQRLVERQQMVFKGHLTAYAGVNTFLFLLNLFSSGLGFPWFIFPAGGWGIGIVTEYVALRGHGKVLEEVKRLPPMKTAPLKEFRTLKKVEKKHRNTAASMGSTAAFLVAVNLITTGLTVPWSIIPVTIFGALFFAKHSVYTERVRKISERFHTLLRQQGSTKGYYPGLETGAVNDGRDSFGGAASRYEYEARTVADAVFERLQKLEGVQQISDEAANILHTYLEQVKLLSTQVEEIDSIMREIPKAEIEDDRTHLEHKIEETTSEQLKREYQRSIEEIDQHLVAYHQLEEQREVIDLRIHSAINTLKKLRLDIARINSVTQVQTMPHFDEVKRQSEELSHYIRDLAGGYEEVK
ncbi:MAG: 2TM domain-containing protein [Spirochaetota bacterium]